MQVGTVLIVEDDPDIRESMRLFLEFEGYGVVEAADGVAGLATLRQSRQGLVVLVDYRMPRMDGIQMLTEVSKHARLARSHAYLLVTANYDQLPSSSQQLLTALHIDSVNKPFDLDALLEAVVRAQQSLSRSGTQTNPPPDGGETPGGSSGHLSMREIWQFLDSPPHQRG